MSSHPDISWDQLDALTAREFDCFSASEIAGILHGLVCAGLSAEQSVVSFAAEVFHITEALSVESESVLEQLKARTFQDYQADSYSIELTLPEDDAGLSHQVEELGRWCQGFLYGFSALTKGVSINEDAEEAVKDLTEISQLDAGVADEEEMESAFVTVTEHVKMSVQIIYCENQKLPHVQPTDHRHYH